MTQIDQQSEGNETMKRDSVAIALTMCICFGSALISHTPVAAQDAAVQEVAGQFAEINGMRMHYKIHGAGEPLVLLHGFTGSSTNWDPFVEDLAEQYQLIVPDLRGHGRSTNPSNQFTHRQSALDIYALLDELEIKTFRGMGISTGGMTLIHMATQQPARAEAIVLIGATIYFPESAREIMRETTVEGLSDERWQAHRERHKNGDDQIRALVNQFHGFKDSYSDMNFTPPFLSTISARTFVVHGDRDRFFPVNIPVEMYRNIPQSYLWIIPNGGHVPIYGSNQATFTEKALEFLSGDWE